MKKRKFFIVAVAALLAIILFAMPAVPSISISSEGFLSLYIEQGAVGAQEPPPIGEVVEQRTRNSKTSYLGNNSYSWDGTIGSIHYEDNGWQEIDNEFVPAGELSPWDWEMTHAGYHIRVLEDFTYGQILEFEVQGEVVQLQPMNLEWTNDLDQIQLVNEPQSTTPVITNPEADLLPAVGVLSHQGTIRWNDAYGDGIDFEWRCTSTRLNKVLEIETLNKLPIPEQYILDGGNPVLRLNLIFDPSGDMEIYVDGELWDRKAKKQTFDIIEFRKGNEVFWGFMPLKYWGSGQGEENEGQSVATLEKRGNKLYISVRIPYDWLQTAAYPVFIDTDVDEDIVAGLDDASERGDGTFQDSHTYLYIRSYTDDTHDSYRCTGLRWQTVNVPQGAEILNGTYFQFNMSSAPHWINTKIYGNDVDNAVDFSTNPHIISTGDRPRTSESVSWVERLPAPTGWFTSPEIKTIIQEIVSRGSWQVNNNLVLLAIANTDVSYTTLFFNAYDRGPEYAEKLHIEYTAGACEEDISNAPSSRAWGTVAIGTDSNTAINFFTITNNSGGAVSITVEATDFTGGDDTWTLSDTATAGENIYGLKAGLDDDDDNFDVIVKKTSPNTLVAGLADEATQDWGLKLYMPTSVPDYDNQLMDATVTLIATCD